MIKSLKLYNSCVASMRKAQKEYQDNPTPFNRGIMLDLQNKVDAWIEWINKQHDGELARNLPPFIPQNNMEGPRGKLDNNIIQQLRKTHSQEEIDNLFKTISMNKLQLQFTSGTPIGEQEKMTIKKLQAKILEVLSEEGDKAYDKNGDLTISFPLSEIPLVTKLFNVRCVIPQTDNDGYKGDKYFVMLSSVKSNSGKRIKVTINGSIVKNVYQSNEFTVLINESCKENVSRFFRHPTLYPFA